MSTLKTKKVQLGDNADPSKNFLIEVPAVADGTLTIKREDGTNVLSVSNTGVVSIAPPADPYNTSAGALLAVGAFGLGASHPKWIGDLDNKLTRSGIYICADGDVGDKPSSYGVVLVVSFTGGDSYSTWSNQVFFGVNNVIYARSSINLASWSAWRTL